MFNFNRWKSRKKSRKCFTKILRSSKTVADDKMLRESHDYVPTRCCVHLSHSTRTSDANMTSDMHYEVIAWHKWHAHIYISISFYKLSNKCHCNKNWHPAWHVAWRSVTSDRILWHLTWALWHESHNWYYDMCLTPDRYTHSQQNHECCLLVSKHDCIFCSRNNLY